MSNDPHTVLIENVRLSFPCLFTAKQGRDANGQPQGKPMFSAVFLMDKVTNKKDIDKLTAAALFTKKEKWQEKPVNLPRRSIRDGADKVATDGYGEKVMFISARNEKRPHVVGRKLGPLTETDGVIYAGCYVNAEVRCWAQDNSYGKALNWSLQKVQFVRNGQPFGEKQTPVESVFKPIEDEDDSSPVDTAAANDAI